MKPKITILTGAGISAESGLKTFRDSNGLWEGHDVMQVATPQGWRANQELVLEFYNQRRKQLLEVEPNKAHDSLVRLEKAFDVTIITQNVDDLHERAGSSKVIHLHGELLKARSTINSNHIQYWKKDLKTGDLCPSGFQLRPHIVWFGEEVPMLDTAATIVSATDYLMIVGTSMQVYPAAGLINYAQETTPIYFIDPNPSIASSRYLKVYEERATTGVTRAVQELMSL